MTEKAKEETKVEEEKKTEKSSKTSSSTKNTTKKSSSKKETSTKDNPPKKARMPRKERVYTFEQWARRRGVKQHHKGGMRAYVPNVNKSRSLEEWDNCFVGY